MLNYSNEVVAEASHDTPEGRSVNETYGRLRSLQLKAKTGRKGV